MQPAIRRQIVIWLSVVCFLLLAVVIVGGVVRLTRSGLSIVEWKPVTGIIPPIGEAQWVIEFDKYKQFPEYKQINRGMSLSDFKFIFWWEFMHRLLARFIGGIVFLLPMIYFWLRGYLRPRDKKMSLIVLGLGLLQGLFGWIMVRSGLQHDPHVSHYWLAIHLLTAFLIFCFVFWMILSLYFPDRLSLDQKQQKTAYFAWGVTGLLVLQICYGAFVAGLKAGFIYNTFPLMGDSFAPEGMFLMQPWLANFVESKPLVQFIHRVLAFLLLAVAGVLFYLMKKHDLIDRRQSVSILTFQGMLSIQFLLGVLTILNAVPIALGAAHQGTALLLLGSSLAVNHSLTHSARLSGATRIH